MRFEKLFAIATAVCWMTAAPAGAHHSFSAQFNINQTVTVTGTVTSVRWSNPHAWIYIDVGADDDTVNWAFETATANSLYRRGWRREDLEPGTRVTIEGLAGAKRKPDSQHFEHYIARWPPAVLRGGPGYRSDTLAARGRSLAGRVTAKRGRILGGDDAVMLIHCEESATMKTAPFRRNPMGVGGFGLQALSLVGHDEKPSFRSSLRTCNPKTPARGPRDFCHGLLGRDPSIFSRGPGPCPISRLRHSAWT